MNPSGEMLASADMGPRWIRTEYVSLRWRVRGAEKPKAYPIDDALATLYQIAMGGE